MKTKTRKLKVPRAPRMPKRSEIQVIQDQLREMVSFGNTPAVKTIEEQDGLFIARNERREPVAYFGRHFAEAIQTYAKLLPDNGCCAQEVSKATLPVSEGGTGMTATGSPGPLFSPPPRPITYYIVARSYEAYRRFRDERTMRATNPGRFNFVNVTSGYQLEGVNWGFENRLIRLPGWRDAFCFSERQAIHRAKDREREASVAFATGRGGY